MNILPKKSWHVRTKKNIERIQRDEAEADRLAKIEQDRILNVEQEVRLRDLRSRAGIPEPAEKPFNLFEGFEEQRQTKNKDCENEKRQDEAKFQKTLGVYNKLVRSEDANKPWYCSLKPTINLKNDHSTSSQQQLLESSKKSSKSDLITSIYDPMTAIKEAEEIVRLKRLREKVSETAKCDDKRTLKFFDPKRQQNTPMKNNCTVYSDSSPEIIKVIKAKKKSKRRKDDKNYHKKKKHRKKHKRDRSCRK